MAWDMVHASGREMTTSDEIRRWTEEGLLLSGRSEAEFVPAESLVLPRGADLCRRIEHTILKPEAGHEEIERLCSEARKLDVRAVCVAPRNVSLAAGLVHGTGIRVVAVSGFPLGSTVPKVKGFEAASAAKLGADEIDLVPALDMLVRGEAMAVKDEVMEVIAACKRPVKVILETGLLTPRLMVVGAVAAMAAGASCLKTSTGFGPRGASIDDVTLLRAVAGPHIAIKASGGIRDRVFAESLVSAGADLLGTSSAVDILK